MCETEGLDLGGQREEKVCGLPTLFSVRYSLWFCRQCLLKLGAEIRDYWRKKS